MADHGHILHTALKIQIRNFVLHFCTIVFILNKILMIALSYLYPLFIIISNVL